jgi:hypothetical protein
MRELHRQHPLRNLRLIVACLFGVLITAGASPASAGGWAVASLDAIPEATAGETTEVGFTVLQHGQSPAVLDADVGIELVLADGAIEYFPAVADGAPGHYVAAVTFPDGAGSYQWNARMGWFGSYQLGAIEVIAGAPLEQVTTGGGSVWPDLRWVTLAASVALAGVAVTDALITRARRRTATV